MSLPGGPFGTGTVRFPHRAASLELGVAQLFPFEVFVVVAGKVSDPSFAFEYQQMIHDFVHKIAVVRDDDQAAAESLQVFFEHLQRHDIQIVRRLVQHQEVRIAHQYRAQVEPAPVPRR